MELPAMSDIEGAPEIKALWGGDLTLRAVCMVVGALPEFRICGFGCCGRRFLHFGRNDN
jgi:hypothetical protein